MAARLPPAECFDKNTLINVLKGPSLINRALYAADSLVFAAALYVFQQ